jgi:hypothetical protein
MHILSKQTSVKSSIKIKQEQSEVQDLAENMHEKES